MTKEELQKIIEQFDEEELKQQGIFGIATYGGDSDESFIRANKEGLELFALELLKSAKDFEGMLVDKTKRSIPFGADENWIDENSDAFIHYIEPLADKQKLEPRSDYKMTIVDRISLVGCGLIGIILIISLIVGIVVVMKWIF
ncbi:hypothetical protein [uncultured Fluviicola sp.]|uniref:hypothetical protein n=1 Tax=uncultured Fluviicola sp. TaxID=463303 RepID=UPI0025DB6814|nr:hypothetical protein [uncultured Fluviicola sp.]